MKTKFSGRNGASPLGEVNYQEPLQKRRPKTRKPRPVRPVPGDLLAKVPAGAAALLHSPPRLGTRRGTGKAPPQGGLELLMDEMDHAIETRNWQRLQGLVDTMREQGFRLDEPEFGALFSVRWLVFNAPLDVLEANEGNLESRLRLAVALIDRGCDPKATDSDGNTVAARLRDLASEELLNSVMAEYPSLRAVFGDTLRAND